MSNSLGKELRRLRDKKGWSLDDLQRETGVSRDTLSRIELGKRTPHDSTLRLIARGLRLQRSDTTDPRLSEAIRDESGGGQGTGSEDRPTTRLRELLDYISTLDGKARTDFINAVLAVLTVAGGSDAAASDPPAQKHGR